MLCRASRAVLWCLYAVICCAALCCAVLDHKSDGTQSLAVAAGIKDDKVCMCKHTLYTTHCLDIIDALSANPRCNTPARFPFPGAPPPLRLTPPEMFPL